MDMMVVEPQQNVVARMANLPLVSSTYDMFSTVYCNTKENHPYIKSVCEVAEKSVKTITSVALTSAMPIIQKLEPQIAIANSFACRSLDKIEEKWPILHQPSDKIVANAKDAVTGAKDAVTTTVTGAKESVSFTITGVVDKTKEAVQESVEVTKAVVNGSVNTVMGSHVVKMVSTGLDTVLSKSESLVDMYLPLTEEELATKAKNVDGLELAANKPSYYVRLGSVSTKLRKRAYHQALAKVRDAKQQSHEAISELRHNVDLIEYARQNMDSANQKLHNVQDKLQQSWLEWRKKTGCNDEVHDAELPFCPVIININCKKKLIILSSKHIESRTLAITRGLTHQLQTTCLTIVASVQGLPQNIQDQANSLARSATDIYQNFSSVSSFREVSDTVLASSKGQLTKMKDSVDGVMDYLVNNTPLNWLVPDFTITDLSSEPDDFPYDVDYDGVQNNCSSANGPTQLPMHMFDKPNKDAFYIVAHFLFEKLNPTRANDVFRSLVKSMRDLRAESAEYDRLLKLKNDQNNQERGLRAGKIKKVRSLWACLNEVIYHLKDEKEVVDSVVKGNVDQYTLDGTDVSVKVPRLLLEKIENSVHTSHTGNLYEARNIHFIRVIELLNDALKFLREEQLHTGPYKVDLNVQLIEGQMKLQTKTLQSLKLLREKITKEALPDVKESILEKEKAWDKKWEELLKQNPFSLLNQENPALDLLPAMSALSFEPATEAAYKMSVFSQYPAAFPDSQKEGASTNSFLYDLGKSVEKESNLRRSSLAGITSTPDRAKCTSLAEPCTEPGIVRGARPNELKSELNEVQVSKSLRTPVNDFSCKRKRAQSLGRIQANVLHKEYDNLADKFAEAVAASPAGFERKAFELEDILSTLTSDPFMTRKELPRTPESLLSDIRSSWRKAVAEGEAQQARLSGKHVLDEAEEPPANRVDSSIACFMSPQGTEFEETFSDPVNKLANWMNFATLETPGVSCETKKLLKTGRITDLKSEVSSLNSADNGAGSPDHHPVMEQKLSPEVSFLNMKPASQADRHLENQKLTDSCGLSYRHESGSLHSTVSWNSACMLGIGDSADSSSIVQFGISNETLPEILGNESSQGLCSEDGLGSEDEGMENYTLAANLSEMHQGPRVDLQSFRSRYEKIRQAYSKTFPTEEVEEAHVEIAPQSVDINPEPAQWETADQVFTLDLDFLETLTPTSKDKRLALPKLATFSPLNDIRSVLGDGAEDFDLF
ncbi:Perilipin-2 [Acipenser ruthenus]|uniref:Perilipin-2 n=1 Tax=Acipenser ruthenus TaxID=7906 RepID=A0A662YSV9_ACIRT|nr:Perilipin-2 [Acipenser ruthenus]